MQKLRIVAIFLLLASLSINALAEPEYHLGSRLLIIPSVKIGNSYVYDAKLKLNDAGSFDIIGYSETPSSGGSVGSKCTEDKITLDIFNQISNGMTLEQVTNIIGCTGEIVSVTGNITKYRWASESYGVASIWISFRDDFVALPSYFPK